MWTLIFTNTDGIMALYIWLLALLSVMARGYGNDLEWQPLYTVKATKITLTSHLIENYQMWITVNQTRVDYDDGAVKSIVKFGKSFPIGRTYDIHPQAFLNQTVYTVCYYTDKGTLHNLLPEPYDFDLVDEYDETRGRLTSKYLLEYTVDEEKIRGSQTLWAIFNTTEEYWYPVRYETIEYNTELGYKKNHEIWEFSGFSTNFSEDQVFDLSDYDCTEAPKEHDDDENSDLVTKDLTFIDPENDDHVDYVFNAFKTSYRRKYADDKEHEYRRNIFCDNLRLIVATNNQNLGYKLGVNQFADRTPKEMRKYKGLRRRAAGKSGNIPFPYTRSKLSELSRDLPKEYDLRLYGLVSDVKEQGECGSCWAFATTAVTEGALARVNGGRLLSLANQALIDCAWAFNVYGCGGGDDNGAYKWMMEYGLPTEAEYGPYKNKEGICHIKNMTKKYPIRGYTDVTPRSVVAMKVALINHGPLSVSVHVSKSFELYSSGIFYDTKCGETNLTHEVALVGYGEHYSETFWILKNSWGQNWGIGGYMHISAKDNVCGVATEPTFVVF